MSKHLVTAAGALALLALSAGGPALAYSTVIGGNAGGCSDAAKAGKHDDKSLQMCTEALAGEPLNNHDRAGTFVNRGAMELLNRDNEAAHADFLSALHIVPSMGEAHVGEGAYLITMERWADAENELNQGLSLGSEELEKAYYFRGVARWGQDDFKGAYFDFKKAVELKPSWDLPRQQLANFKCQDSGAAKTCEF